MTHSGAPSAPLPSSRRLDPLACGLLSILSFAAAGSSFSLAHPESPPPATVTIDIRGRQFQPERIVLRRDVGAILRLNNHDSELHAFVPADLLIDVNLNVSGNGAPEFGPQGFRRVVIPSDGLVEIRFTPVRPGEYRYRCDMPGHEMSGTIVVE